MIRFFTLLLCFGMATSSAFAQISIAEDFDASTSLPAGWSDEGSFLIDIEASRSCGGNSWSDNLYGSNTTSFLQSINAPSATADEVTVSFDYQVVNFNSSTPVSPGWGSLTLGYSVNGGAFTTIATIDDSNYAGVGSCTTVPVSIPAGTLTAGDAVDFRFDFTRTAGDWDGFIDNFSAIQPGACFNPTLDYSVVSDCDNSGGYFIDATVTDLGGATTLNLNDDQGSAAQTATTVGDVVRFGPYTIATDVVISTANADNAICATMSSTLTLAACPPANDLCDDAIALTCGAPAITGNTVGALTNFAPASGNTLGLSIWYTFTGTGTEVTVTSVAPVIDHEVIVLGGDCGTLTELGRADGTSGTESVTILTDVGTTYYVVIGHYLASSSTTGEFTVEITCATCTEPTATATAVNNCAANDDFNIVVDITDMGTATSLNVTDGTTTMTANGIGELTFTGYASGTGNVTFTITNEQDGTCEITETANVGFCPPANDLCDDAIALVCNDPAITASTEGATTNFDPATGNDTGLSVWYTFMGTGNEVTVSSTALSIDHEVIVLGGDCATLTELGRADGAGGTTGTETVTIPTTAGTSYYVVIGYYSAGSSIVGEFEVAITCATCAEPEATVTTVNNCETSGDFDVVVDITNMGSATSLSVTDGTTTMTANATGELTFTGYAAGTGDVDFTITNVQDGSCEITETANVGFCPPANDLCDDAITLVCNDPAITGNTAAATTNFDPATGNDTGLSIWYTFMGTGNEITVSSMALSIDHEVIVLEGDCATLTEVGRADGAGSSGTETVTIPTTAGTAYYVVIGYYSANSTIVGEFEVAITCATCAEPEATATAVNDCDVSGNFNIVVDITDMGSATSLTVTDGATTMTANAIGELTFTGYAPETGNVTLTITNDQDGSCEITETVNIGACPPPNDACANAIALTDATGAATAENGMTINTSFSDPAQSRAAETCAGFSNADTGDDIWFTVTAPTSAGDIITITAESPSDIVIVLFTNDCANPVFLDCSDSESTLNPEVITFTVPAERSTSSGSAAAQTYLVQAYTYNGGGADITVSATVESQLPVELTSFTGESMEKANKLNWVTAREEATDRYVVERSPVGSNQWETIDEVLAAGDSETESTYEMMDEQPLISALYRLKMMDLDGSFEYSNIIQLENSSVIADQLSVFPVPTSDVVSINFIAEASGEAVLNLTDMMGRTISQQSIKVNAGLQTQTIDLSTVASGAYLVRVNVDGRQMVKRVIRR